jgi:hypothetical protein
MGNVLASKTATAMCTSQNTSIVALLIGLLGIVLAVIALAMNRVPGPRGPIGPPGTSPIQLSDLEQIRNGTPSNVPSVFIRYNGPQMEKQASFPLDGSNQSVIVKYDGEPQVKNLEDVNGEYNPDSGIWTVHSKGFYMIRASICFIWYTTFVDERPVCNLSMDLRVNGALKDTRVFTIDRMSTYLTGGGDTHLIHSKLFLQAGDKVSIHLTRRSISHQGNLFQRPVRLELVGYT